VADIKITIKNMAEIRAAFAKAPGLTVKALNRAIQRSIFTIERDSKRATPVDTGFLRASHRSLFSNLRGEVGPTAVYAPFVHDGTSRMMSRPFLLEAVQSNERRVQGYFESEVQDVLDTIARAAS
jgi:HK97 gp10 family phage protein